MCQELQKNLQVVHDQVTINHVLISAGKQKSKHKLQNLHGGQLHL